MRLWSFEKRWMGDILDTMLPSAPSDIVPTADPDSARVSAFFDSFMDRAPFDAGLGVRAAIWVITFGTIFWRLKLRMFGQLPREQRTEFLDTLAQSDIYLLREIPTLVKTIGCFALFSGEDTHAVLGAQTPSGEPPLWLDSDPVAKG